MSESDFVVIFEKSKDYNRFSASGVLINDRNGLVYMDIYEETLPYVEKFVFHEDGSSDNSIFGNANLINYIHSTVAVSPETIPKLISSLQTFYDGYLNKLSSRSSTDGDS